MSRGVRWRSYSPWRWCSRCCGGGRTRSLSSRLLFGSVIVLNLATLIDGPATSVGLYTMIYVLLVPYALLRWGSGREVVIGSSIIVVACLLGIASDFTDFGEAAAGFVFLMFPAVLGALVRFWTTSRAREIDQVRLREREQLARELHDTVAHHVSAMVVRAQAGRVVAAVAARSRSRGSRDHRGGRLPHPRRDAEHGGCAARR